MEKRIRIVWALSLISMLLLVAGQGYWLWNQYQYKNEEYEEELHRLVMDAVAVNDSIRREQPKKVFNKPNISFFNTNVDMHTDRDSLTNKLKERYTRTFVVGAMADKSVLSTAMKDSIVYKDKIVIHGEDKLLFNMSFSEAIVAYQLQIDVPFTLQRFDSVLATKLDGMSFTTGLVTPRDSLYQWVETVERLGSDLHPVIRLVYPYNPLMRELVQVDVQVMPHTLLLRMGWQLLGSLVLILLLAVCLLFQIKTILKQHRVDELRKSFVNTMIHELKRPVQALKMCVSFLNDKTMRTDEQAMDEVVREARDKGYVETLFKRRRELPDINSRNFNIRSFAERTAINSPIQGSAADILKIAMIQLDKALVAGGYQTKMLLQVHDEIVLEVPKSELAEMKKLVKQTMEEAIQLSVPLIADENEGCTWYEAK